MLSLLITESNIKTESANKCICGTGLSTLFMKILISFILLAKIFHSAAVHKGSSWKEKQVLKMS
jgi:hypothetical protein